MELQGKTAIVTGSGRGIGAGIALAFGLEGANVVVNSFRAAECTDVVQQILDAGGSAIPFGADVTRLDQIEAMVAATVERFGAVDILVNNAGIESMPAQLKDISEEQWDRTLGVNLKGVFLCCKAVIPTMMAQNKGKIVTIGSLAGQRMTFFGGADYTVSKYGASGLTQHLAWELAEYHINVNLICPGPVLTPLAEEGTTPGYREFVTKRLIPLGRWSTPDDIAQTAIYLASHRSDQVTGQRIEVDGGIMQGYGEDLRSVIKERMHEMQAAHAAQH